MNRTIRSTRAAAFALSLAAVAATGCTDNVEDYYSHEAAFLRFTPVSGVAPLYTALNSAGMFCTIRIGGSHFYFAGSDGNTQNYPKTAIVESYGTPVCISGFVVGISSIPDINMRMSPVAYDLVCPTCYEQSLIQRTLVFSESEALKCGRCGRVYDLSNGGIIKEGEEGTKLYRYHITYSEAANPLYIYN